ncbi:MAG TPA: hypothetical protein VL994_11220, partial [Steroidobacteraceae bacterium]|nr:hypothetical protein [Steroidobacteraceae bacterium]
ALFQPAGIYTQHAGHRWLRIYPNTDINAWVSFGEVKVFDPIHSDNIIDLGSELSWLAHPRKLTCERKNGHYSVVVAPEPNRQ